jgi:hypothetical protein
MSNNKEEIVNPRVQALMYLEQDFKGDKIDKLTYYELKEELETISRVKDLSPEAYKYIRKSYNKKFYTSKKNNKES